MALKLVVRKFSQLKPICIEYKQLLSNEDLSLQISHAYGSTGLGILAVKGIPGYSDKRNKLLPIARELALLSQKIKEPLELKEHKYSVGWSHGKENYGGIPDFSKGSYYANPEVDKPFEEGEWPNNVWPREALPQLEPAFKSLGQEMIRVGGLLARHLDNFISKQVESYTPGTLEKIISEHKSHVGRLLHYFPQENSNQD